MEAAAASLKLTLQKSQSPFTRSSFVPGFGGQYSQAAGAAFSLPVGAVSAPIRDDAQVTVLRVDHRVTADSAAWEKQKVAQRDQRLRLLRQTRVDMFLQDLHDAARIDDRRKQLQNVVRRTAG